MQTFVVHWYNTRHIAMLATTPLMNSVGSHWQHKNGTVFMFQHCNIVGSHWQHKNGTVFMFQYCNIMAQNKKIPTFTYVTVLLLTKVVHYGALFFEGQGQWTVTRVIVWWPWTLRQTSDTQKHLTVVMKSECLLQQEHTRTWLVIITWTLKHIITISFCLNLHSIITISFNLYLQRTACISTP